MRTIILAATFLVGCNTIAAVAPSAIADAACIIADGESGKSISQIVIDCGGDTAQVIAVLTDPANYSKTNSTVAYAEAGRVKLALSKTP
jgi:hypothetical protein